MPKFGIKAASSCEISDERALAKLSLNFRKCSRPPIVYRTFGEQTRLALVFFFVALCCISHTEAQTERTYCQDTLHFPSNSVGWRNSKPQFASPERRNENIKYFLEDESNPQRVAFTLLQSHSGALRHDSPHVDVDVWRIFIHVVKWLNYEFKITGTLLVLRNG